MPIDAIIYVENDGIFPGKLKKKEAAGSAYLPRTLHFHVR